VADETSARIFDAMNNIRADAWPLDEMGCIGMRGVRRIDGYEKATGAAIYTLDISLPGMLHARYLTSPYPHAAIKTMDTSKAERLDGVRAILRYDDPELPAAVDLGGHVPSAERPVPRIAYFEGQEVGAVVAADSVDIAEEALRLIEVEWEELPFVLDPLEALRPGAPLAKPEAFPVGNLAYEYKAESGDVDQAFAEADVVVELSYRQHLNTWVAPERPCGVFRWNGDWPEIWVKHQRPHICKRAVALWFSVPMSKVLVHCPRQGAVFGGWTQIARNMFGNYCAGVISKRTGRPVKWTMNQDEGVVALKVGARHDGTITAVEGNAVLVNQEMPFFGFMVHLKENTRIHNLREHMRVAWVNKVATIPCRCEQKANVDTLNLACNKVAAALGLDPVQVALANDGADGHDMAWLDQRKVELGFAQRDSLRECVELGKAAIDWDAKWHPPATRSLGDHRMHGLGFAWTHEWDDSGGSSEIAMRLERHDGSVSILGCRADVGVNAETAYCQIAAAEKPSSTGPRRTPASLR
jgi:CO/xanthine dehydrogenase Mo-binding subunit